MTNRDSLIDGPIGTFLVFMVISLSGHLFWEMIIYIYTHLHWN